MRHSHLCHGAAAFRFTARKEEGPLGSSWIHRVLQDRLLLEATLLNAAVHLDGLHKRESTPLTLRHRGETIRMINRTLHSSEPASDSNIGAVVLLAWCEVCSILLHTSLAVTEQ